MKKIIFDTSVAFKFFYHKDEKNAQEVINLFEYVIENDIQIIEPDIFLYELGNVFIRAKKLTLPEIRTNFELLFQLNLEIVNLNYKLIIKITELAQEFNLTFYDAAYLALAIDMDIDLISDDREIINTKIKNVKPILDVALQS